jgi:hypothetical protein
MAGWAGLCLDGTGQAMPLHAKRGGLWACVMKYFGSAHNVAFLMKDARRA